jgi:hypothetical protein
MNDVEENQLTEHTAAMLAIKNITEGQYEKAIGYLADAIRAESTKHVLLMQELRKAAEESESNV